MRYILVLLTGVLISFSARAEEPDAYVKFVMKLRDHAVAALGQGQDAELASFCGLTAQYADLEAMAEFAYGRNAGLMSPSDASLYLGQFKNYLVNSLRSAFKRFDLSRDVEFRPQSIKSGKARIVSAVVGRSETKPGVDVKFIVRETANGELKLYNAKFMDVDMLFYLRNTIQEMAGDPAAENQLAKIQGGLSSFPKCE